MFGWITRVFGSTPLPASQASPFTLLTDDIIKYIVLAWKEDYPCTYHRWAAAFGRTCRRHCNLINPRLIRVRWWGTFQSGAAYGSTHVTRVHALDAWHPCTMAIPYAIAAAQLGRNNAHALAKYDLSVYHEVRLLQTVLRIDWNRETGEDQEMYPYESHFDSMVYIAEQRGDYDIVRTLLAMHEFQPPGYVDGIYSKSIMNAHGAVLVTGARHGTPFHISPKGMHGDRESKSTPCAGKLHGPDYYRHRLHAAFNSNNADYIVWFTEWLLRCVEVHPARMREYWRTGAMCMYGAQDLAAVQLVHEHLSQLTDGGAHPAVALDIHDVRLVIERAIVGPLPVLRWLWERYVHPVKGLGWPAKTGFYDRIGQIRRADVAEYLDGHVKAGTLRVVNPRTQLPITGIYMSTATHVNHAPT